MRKLFSRKTRIKLTRENWQTKGVGERIAEFAGRNTSLCAATRYSDAELSELMKWQLAGQTFLPGNRERGDR